MGSSLKVNSTCSELPESRIFVKGLTEAENFPSAQPRFAPKFATMTKVVSFGVFFSLLVIIVLVIIANFVTNGQKPRTKVLKTKKTITTTTTTTTTSTTTPTPTPTPTPVLGYYETIFASSTFPPTIKENVFTNENLMHSTQTILGRSFQPCPSTCEQEKCAPIGSACPLGLVLDHCYCCYVCGVGEGSRCYNASQNHPKSSDEGICGHGLFCLMRLDLETNEPVEAICECRNSRKVCGNDNVTYSSECQLREASHFKQNLSITAWNPCVTAPLIKTAMENVTSAIGTDVSLNCEFRSFPASIIHWEFAPEASTERIVLPGDDSSIIQTNRGGPEDMMTTSWIQIISVEPSRQGIYYCLAKNTEGMNQSFAHVSVYRKSNHTFPIIMGKK